MDAQKALWHALFAYMFKLRLYVTVSNRSVTSLQCRQVTQRARNVDDVASTLKRHLPAGDGGK